MDRLTAALLAFLILLSIIFIINYFVIDKNYLKVISGKKKKKKYNDELLELSYLVFKFDLDMEKLKLNRLLMLTSFINAFIISIVAVTVLLLRINIILELLIGFILLFALIYSIYELLGKYLVKKGYKKNGK